MQALVIAGHGSHLNPGASEPAFAHADAVRESGAFDEVRAAFWKEEPAFREVLRTLAADEVFVVPLFVAEGYFTERVVPRELRLDGWSAGAWESDGTSATAATFRARDVAKTVHYCGPVGTHDAMTDVVVRRATSVAGAATAGDEVAVAVVAHGTERNENSAKAARYHADRLRERDQFADVRTFFLDEDPRVEDVPTAIDAAGVVVVPFFVADGYHTREDIPEALGIADAGGLGDGRATGRDGGGRVERDADRRRAEPTAVDGTRVWYTGAVGTDPLVADVILRRARDAGADVGDAIDSVLDGPAADRPGVAGSDADGDGGSP